MAVLCGLGLKAGDAIKDLQSLAEVGPKDLKITECFTIQIKVNTIFKIEGMVGVLSECLTHPEL